MPTIKEEWGEMADLKGIIHKYLLANSFISLVLLANRFISLVYFY